MNEENAMKPELEMLKTKLRATWTAGDFSQIAKAYTKGAEQFVDRLQLKPGTLRIEEPELMPHGRPNHPPPPIDFCFYSLRNY